MQNTSKITLENLGQWNQLTLSLKRQAILLFLVFSFAGFFPSVSQLFAAVNFLEVAGADPVRDVNFLGSGANTVYSAWGDYDLDGDQDVYIVNDGSPNALYRNELCSYVSPCESVNAAIGLTRPLRFTKMTVSSNPRLVVLKDGISSSKFARWVDYDQDGDLDLYLVNDGMNRLFINELFNSNKPYDPFSGVRVDQQAVAQNTFFYKPHPLILPNLGSQDDMQVVTELAIPAGSPFPKTGTQDTFEDVGRDYLSIAPQITRGMYLEVTQSANPAEVGRRFTILEVLNATQLRLERENEIEGIFGYKILRDTVSELQNIDLFRDQFRSDGTVVSNSILYDYDGGDATFSVQTQQIQDNDKVVINAVGNTAARTISTIIQAVQQNITLRPEPRLGGQVVTDNFDLNIRRAGGEIILQKFFVDPATNIQFFWVQPGDELEILSGANQGRRYTIESISQEGIVFLDSSPGTPPLSQENGPVQYQYIYNAFNTRTQRVLRDLGATFGSDPATFVQGADSNTRMVKVGDKIVLNPNLTVSRLRTANVGESDFTAPGPRITFDDGSTRPVGVMEVKQVLGDKELILDAFPSEVALGAPNQNFSYHIRHSFGTLAVDQIEGTIKFFSEFSPNGPGRRRDFLQSLGLRLVAASQNNPFLILTDGRPNTIGNQPELILPNVYDGPINDNYTSNRIELLTPVNPTEVTTTTNLEFRQVYVGLGAQNPFTNSRILRFFGEALPPGFGAGDVIFLRGFTDTFGTAQRINQGIRILQTAGTGVVDLTLQEDIPQILLDDFQRNCDVSANCDATAGATESQNAFFQDVASALSVEYEFVSSQALLLGAFQELSVKGRVRAFYSGFQWGELSLSPGDSIEYKNVLTGSLRSSTIATELSTNEIELGGVDGQFAPYNVDIPRGQIGFKPIWRGLLTDFRTLTTSNPRMNFTSWANSNDLVTFFSEVPNQGLSMVASVEIANVTTAVVTLRRRLTLDPALQGIPASQFQTNPFYFRFTRTTGNLQSQISFIDRRPGLDFQQKLKINPDLSVRGVVLLDLYRQSDTVNDPLYKRFQPTELFSNNRLALQAEGVDLVADIGSGYFYELNQLVRDPGGIAENHPGNGVMATFSDWNRDGVKDLYYANAPDVAGLNVELNSSQILYGTTLTDITTGLRFIAPVTSPADNNNELRNLPSQSANLTTTLLVPSFVTDADLDQDLKPDLLILNNNLADRLFLTRRVEVNTFAGPLLSAKPVDGLDPGDLRGINRPGKLANVTWGSTGDINQDGRADVVAFTGVTVSNNPVLAQQATDNNALTTLWLNGANGFNSRAFQINDTNLNPALSGTSRAGAILDYNNDGFADVSLLNADRPWILEPRLRGNSNIGTGSILAPTCGISGTNENAHISWVDVNLDGFQDYYVSRASTTGSTNLLCLSQPQVLERTNNNFFVFDVFPRDMSQFPGVKDIRKGRIYLNVGANALISKPAEFTLYQDFEYSYPTPLRFLVSTGPITQATVSVEWPDHSFYDYGVLQATSRSNRVHRLEQPGDFLFTSTKLLDSAKGSPVSTPTTFIGPQTTNVEALSVTVSGGRREPVELTRMGVLFAGTSFLTEPTLSDLIPNGSVKLFVDGSLADAGSDDFKNFTANGRFDPGVDVELASTSLVLQQLGNTSLEREFLNESGNPLLGTEQAVVADFSSIRYRSRNGSSTTTIVLNPSVDGAPADKIDLLVVYTVDVNPANPSFSAAGIKVLPYLPYSTASGFLKERSFLALNVENDPLGLNRFNNNSYNQTVGLSFKGTRSLQEHKGIEVDVTNLGSSGFTTLSTKSTRSVTLINLRTLKGVQATIDQTSPSVPILDDAILRNVRETSVLLFGGAEAFSTVRITNQDTGAEPFFVTVNPQGSWQVLITGLQEGPNRLQINAVDLFGNESAFLNVTINVDLTAPLVIGPLATNIGIATATISFQTNESAVASVVLTPVGINLAQPFFNSAQLVQQHSVVVGQTNALLSGLDLNVVPPLVPSPQNCRLRVAGIPNFAALCPDTQYNVSIQVTDSLGNTRFLTSILSFRTLATSQILRDLDGDGTNDQDTDGDGIPDRIEADFNRFPDLNMFDASDALLDFDSDGINNVEEFQNGKDMYNAFDQLPIANAGIDETLDPGLIILDSSRSNFNGVATSQLNFIWAIESAPNQLPSTFPTPPVIDQPTLAKTFIAARRSGVYQISLLLTTDQGAESKKDIVDYTIRNLAPVADAGTGNFGLINTDIPLDGRGSSDTNNDALTFRWIQLQGPALASLGGLNGIKSTTSPLTSFRTSRTGRYVFELIVTDEFGLQDRDRVTYFVNSSVDVFPIADAGEDLSVAQNEPVQLQGDRSGGVNAASQLIYNWDLITTVTQNVPTRCEPFRATNTTGAQPLVSNLRNPSITFSEPGVYAYKLTVQEAGKGLESEPDCVKILVNPVGKVLPMSNPKVFGTPVKLRDSLTGTASSASISKLGQSVNQVYRVPVNFEVQLSGLESFPDQSVVAQNTAGTFVQASPGDDCSTKDVAYKWTQLTGPKVKLEPVVSDCSVVKFIPVEVAVYGFGLTLRDRVDGVVRNSLERTLAILVQDSNGEVTSNTGSGENDFIPTISANSTGNVFTVGNLALGAPSCIDQDYSSVFSTLNVAAVGPNEFPVTSFVPCSALPGMSCNFKQLEGPTLTIVDPKDCNLNLSNVKAGTYRLEASAFDGKYQSIPAYYNFVVVGNGQSVPIANAGVDLTGRVNQAVVLQGNLSISQQGSGLKFLWAQVSGMPVFLRNANTANPTFTPVAADTYKFKLQVQDNNGIRSLPDEVSVFVPSSSVGQVGNNNGNAVQDPITQQKAFEESGGGGGGGCFVATAASGSTESYLVQALSRFRDQILLEFRWGRAFVTAYYQYSPPLAAQIEKSSTLQALVSSTLLPFAVLLDPSNSLGLMTLLILLSLSLLWLRKANSEHS